MIVKKSSAYIKLGDSAPSLPAEKTTTNAPPGILYLWADDGAKIVKRAYSYHKKEAKKCTKPRRNEF